MGKTPMRKVSNYRSNPYNGTQQQQQTTGMPFVVLQRFDGSLNGVNNQGYNNRDGNYRESPFQQRGMSPFIPAPHQQNCPPPAYQQQHNSAKRGRGGYNNFVQRRHQPVPSPFHHPPQHPHGFNHPGNHPSPMMRQHPPPMMPHHPSPMMQHFHPPTQHRPPFPPQQQWQQKSNNRGKRQQTPMKKAPTSMTLASKKNASKVIKGPVRSPIKTRKSMTSAQILETKKNLVPIKLTEKDDKKEVVKDDKKEMTKNEKMKKIPQRSPIKTRKSSTSTQLLADSNKVTSKTDTKPVRSPIKLRKSIGPRQIIPETIAAKKEAIEKRKSLVNQRKSLDTKNRLSMPGNSTSNAKRLSMPSNAVISTATQEKKTIAERRKSQLANTKRLSMPSNAVISTAKQEKKTIAEIRKSQLLTKCLSMPGNATTLSIAPVNKKIADTAERRKSIKRLSTPAQNAKTLSVAVSKRKSLINVIPKETVKKIEPAKKVEALKKVEAAKKVEAVKKVEAAKKVEEIKKVEPAVKEMAKKGEPSKNITKKSPVNKTESKVATESPSYHTPELILPTRSTRSTTRNLTDFKLCDYDVINNSSRDRLVITTRRSISQVKSVEKKQENIKKSEENTSPNNARSKSRGKSEDKTIKRKRSLSEAPVVTPNKKTKTMSSQVSNGTPRSGFIITPSRRQLLTPRASVGTSKPTSRTPKSANTQRSPKSQPITPKHKNRAALMVQTCLNQQEGKQKPPLINLGATDIWRIGHSVAVQTVDPSDVLSDYDKRRLESESSSDEEEEEEKNEILKKNKFMKQVNEFKRSVTDGCVVM